MKKETNNERGAGRKPLYGNKETVLARVLIRKDKEKEMRAEIKAVQDKYRILNHIESKEIILYEDICQLRNIIPNAMDIFKKIYQEQHNNSKEISSLEFKELVINAKVLVKDIFPLFVQKI